MKKKTPTNKMKIKIYVENLERSFSFTVTPSTTLKEISIDLCKELNMDVFRSDISFKMKYGDRNLNIAQTLFQNQIDSSKQLYAKIDSFNARGSYYNFFFTESKN